MAEAAKPSIDGQIIDLYTGRLNVVDPDVDEKLQKLELDNEITTVEASYHNSEDPNHINLSIPENIIKDDVTPFPRLRTGIFYCQMLLQVLSHMVPNEKRTRTINLLHVSLPGPLLPFKSWTLAWLFKGLRQRKGKVVIRRLKVTASLHSNEEHLLGLPQEVEYEIKTWMDANNIQIDALTILPDYTNSYSTITPSEIDSQPPLPRELLRGERVGIAIVPPLQSNVFITTVLKAVCPGSQLILDYAPEQDLLDNSSVATAIDNLRERWRRDQGELHSLVALIHCGGSFREDVMRAINNAVSDGIIVVCPAGFGDHITFPASMGNVICVGAADKDGHAAPYSPSGREIDWLRQPIQNVSWDIIIEYTATGNAATIAASFIARLCSHLHEVMSTSQPKQQLMHVAVIKEVLKETTQFRTHNDHRGYGLLTEKVFSFSKSRLKKIRERVTAAGRSPDINVSAESLVQQCKHNSRVFANEDLNEHIQAGVILEGKGIKITVIDDDFPEVFLGEYKKASILKEEIVEFNPKATKLQEQLDRMQDLATSVEGTVHELRESTPDWTETAISLLEKTASLLEEKCKLLWDEAKKYTPVKESHGLQCALVLANTVPEAELFLTNISATATEGSTELAKAIQKVTEEQGKCPDILVCSMAFDNFDPELAKAINNAINKGVVPVFTAGNTGTTSRNTISYPAKLGNVICIGAHSCYGAVQSFSSIGREVDFLAPGEFMILDDHPVSGTSFAAPAAAAMIALILEYTNSSVVVQEENGHYAEIRAWCEYPPQSGLWQWEMMPIHKACRNVYVMRQLLRQISLDPTTHVHGSGHGLLDITRLAIDLSPADLHRVVQHFYKSDRSADRPIAAEDPDIR